VVVGFSSPRSVRAAIVVVAVVVRLAICAATVLAEPAVSPCTIDQFLSGKSSPMAGNGQAFVDNGLKYVVDPRLVVAIAGDETTFGTAGACSAVFNAWDWFWCIADGSCSGSDSTAVKCSRSPFASWAAGDLTVTKFLNKSYLNQGYTTIPLIGSKFCTSGCDSWVSLVTAFYTQLGGDTSNLGLSSIDTSGCGNPNPECIGATCSTFIPCASSGSCQAPVCATTAGGGGVCVEGETPCAGLLPCTTSADCPNAGICAVGSCCGQPVCVPRSAFCLP
jgi:hypothetical protein